MEIILDNGDTENKKEIVHEKREKDFADLGNHIPPGFDDMFLNNIFAAKCKLEMAMNIIGNAKIHF